MLRFWLLGGKRIVLPWELLVTIGGALLSAAVLLVFFFPLWSTYPVVGLFETAIFAGFGGALLAIGAFRRWQTSKRR